MSDAYNRSRNSISEKQWPKRLEKNYNGARRVDYFASANNQTQSQPFYCISSVIKQTQQFYLLTHFRRSWDLWAFSQQTRKCTSRDRGKVKHQHRNVSGLAKKTNKKKTNGAPEICLRERKCALKYTIKAFDIFNKRTLEMSFSPEKRQFTLWFSLWSSCGWDFEKRNQKKPQFYFIAHL